MFRIVLMLALVSLALAGCLTSDEPKLQPGDLAKLEGFGGLYSVAAFPGSDPHATGEARVDARDGEYFMSIKNSDGDNLEKPVLLRILRLAADRYLAVGSDSGSTDSMILYAFVTPRPNGAWRFNMIELQAARRNDALKSVTFRHGATLSFSQVNTTPPTALDQLSGHLDGDQLRALFTDPDFVKAIDDHRGFDLSPKP